MFTSSLSVNEFVLLNDLVIRGSVSGTIAYREEAVTLEAEGLQSKLLTSRQQQILSLAFTRLQDSAARLGADGVIGVQVIKQLLENKVWECTVSGTAISGMNSAGGERPFLCTLSGQEVWALKQSGSRPIGVAYGVSSYFQKSHQRVEQKVGLQINVERSDFTRGLYAARKYALTALMKAGEKLNAEGVLAVQITTKRTRHPESGISQGMLIEFAALGTAVVSQETHHFGIDYAQPLTD